MLAHRQSSKTLSCCSETARCLMLHTVCFPVRRKLSKRLVA